MSTPTPTPDRVTMVRTLQGDTLSGIIWRHSGQRAGAVEAALAANPALAHLPAVLPAGVPIYLPASLPAPQRATLALWD